MQTTPDDILTVIKVLLKTRGQTYAQLAEAAKIPLSSLKKILAGSGDLPVSKLLDICAALGVSFADVANEAAKLHDAPKTFSLGVDDEAFLADHLEHYVVFLAIMRGVTSTERLATHTGLAPRALREYLDVLERRALVRQDSQGTYAVRGEGAFALSTKSLLYKRSFGAEFAAFTAHVASRISSPSGKGRLHVENGSVRCSKETYERFKNAMKALVDEFIPAFLRDKKMCREEDLERYNFLLCMTPFDWTKSFFERLDP